MGTCASSNQVKPASQQEYSPLEIKVAEILAKKAKVRNADTSGSKFSWDRIILKFPGIAANFRRVETVFAKYDTDNDGNVSMDELRQCMSDLGADITDEDLAKLFEGVDLDKSRALDKKEFLLCLAIGYVSEYFPGSNNVMTTTGPASVTLTETFDLVIQAFLTFDASGDGFIDREEVLQIFRKDGASRATKQQRASRSVISEERWKEMDWNEDGSISFKEFLLAFGSWVGLDDDIDGNYKGAMN